MRTALAIVAACAASASADHIIEYNFLINTAQATPAPDVAGFSPSGTGLVTLNTDTNEITWSVAYQGLTGPIVAPGAHFHGPADFGQTAGVEIFLSDGNPNEPATGVLMGSAFLSASQSADLQAGLWYVNIHTARNPSGEIRGQVVPAPAGAAALAGAGLLATRRRRSSHA